MGDGEKASLRLQFNPKVRLAFHGATITTDAGLLAFREFDDALGLTTWPREDPRLATGRGGVSGRPLFPHMLRIVEDIRKRAGEGLTINACGGISSGEDTVAALVAGANTVQVFTGFVYGGPGGTDGGDQPPHPPVHGPGGDILHQGYCWVRRRRPAVGLEPVGHAGDWYNSDWGHRAPGADGLSKENLRGMDRHRHSHVWADHHRVYTHQASVSVHEWPSRVPRPQMQANSDPIPPVRRSLLPLAAHPDYHPSSGGAHHTPGVAQGHHPLPCL